ncbi:hypothetical protein E2C01_051038 [Portunus trituberculatus]|uniref:Uncharacterized protein n=1 Tax=Portunus trituberculatus TaxID=210409 RepID=A0A5B7GHJ4_PORTR|nr:hypothetical protein [Portunus trituberculatus]
MVENWEDSRAWAREQVKSFAPTSLPPPQPRLRCLLTSFPGIYRATVIFVTVHSVPSAVFAVPSVVCAVPSVVCSDFLLLCLSTPLTRDVTTLAGARAQCIASLSLSSNERRGPENA